MKAFYRVVLLLALSPLAVASIVSGRPDAIVCSVSDPTKVLPWDELVFYVSARTEDGATLYKTMTSSPVLIQVEADGTVTADNLADCDGRTIAELRSEGRAVDF